MANVNVKFDQRQLKRVQSMLRDIPRAMPKVMSRGINNTTKKARTKITRELSKKTKLTQKTVRSKIRFNKATYRKWAAVLSISPRGIPLIQLKAKQLKSGVSFTNPVTASREKLPHAFIAKMPSGHTGVFERAGTSRLPIKEQYAPGMATLYSEAPGIVGRIQNETAADLVKNIRTQIDMVLARRRAG
ncbi:MAG: hypothetical protein DRP56_02040 [Planctomycetota bacterium]|nr:MAG: hypothetical protein DRP56_02040 [Planctomycetota bacterium]